LPKSSAELELEMMEKYKSKPFKATANSNKNLHTGSSAGLTKVTKRRLTTPEPFKFTSSTKPGSKVSSERKQPSEVNHSDEKPKRLKARPVPKRTFSPSIPVHTLKSPTGSGSKGAKEGNATSKASAPKLSASRAEQRRAVVEASTKAAERISKQRAELANKAKKEEDIVFKANDAQLKAKPFNLQSDRRHEAYRKQLEAKRKQEEEDERKKVKFHAKAWKSPPPPPPPVRSKRTPTKPEPFKLESLERHEAFQEMLQVKVASEEEEFKKHLVPKARPLPETTYVYKPISPSPSNLSAKSPGSHGSQALSDVSARS
jgi:hypothetical protein